MDQMISFLRTNLAEAGVSWDGPREASLASAKKFKTSFHDLKRLIILGSEMAYPSGIIVQF